MVRPCHREGVQLPSDPIRSLDQDGHIVVPVYVPHMIAYAIIELITLATVEGGPTAQLLAATRRRDRLGPKAHAARVQADRQLDGAEIGDAVWVTELMKERNEEIEERRKAAAWKRMGGAAPGEPPGESDGGGLAKAKPKGSGKKAKWSSENRGLDKPPRGHVDDRATYDDGKDNKTHPIGTYARFQSTYGDTPRSQLQTWCVCDETKSADKQNPFYPGHWKSTQGNPATQNLHKNPGADGSTFNSFKPRPVQVSRCKAQKMKNQMISEHAKALRSSQLNTTKAIAKIQAIRGYAEGFTESMLHKAAEGLAPYLGTTWAVFSGVRTPETIASADWTNAKKKVQGTHSKNVFDITEYLHQELPSPPTPMQHVVYQLTDAKVHAEPTPEDYHPPRAHPALAVAVRATGAIAVNKRKRGPGDDGDLDSAGAEAEDENEDDGNSGS